MKDLTGADILLIGVVYVNEGTEAVPFSEYDWYLETAGGVRKQDLAFVNAEASAKTLGMGEVAPGGQAVGIVAFRSPGAVNRVVFVPSILAGEDAKATWIP